ncbi:hypothetical protein [Nocardiopsis metallicus]|uniref:Uncharacterized protein n=1 Tax=Nocardiopsis metallicus TaxID=179819 RepID=A0A840WMI6_9ACTN|nr:hypothetical protein [Nocardiopsis metallicus]MBB5494201.1 hypothetical protein [Nocardiopsis metallicus]
MAPATGPPAPEPLKGELPRYYDHVVRIGVEVQPQDEAAFLGAVAGQPWQVQSLGQGRHDVRVPVSGAALGSTGAALAEFHHALNRAGAGVRIVFAARLRPQLSPSRRYMVMPRGWMTRPGWLAAPVRGLMAWRSRGTIQAASLAEARSRLADFANRNPEAGSPDGLTVVGPPDPPRATNPGTDPAPEDLLDDWRFLLATSLLVCVVGGSAILGLYAATWRSEGNVFPVAAASLLALPSGFGVWQMLRHIPEGRINTWLPLGLTTLGVPLTVALSTSNQDAYLAAFGISPGDVVTNGPGRLFALAGFLPALAVLFVSLGAFGLLRYFHLGGRGTEFFPRLMTVLAVCLYGLATLFVLLTTMKGPLEQGAQVGADHVAHYRSEGGAPRGHVGVTPSAVCVEPPDDPVKRIGAPLTTDRPVLYFEGANDIDLLWDREHGLTKVPRFSVSLTPVTDLDDVCPRPRGTG